MAISRMQIPRQLRAGGGIMTLEEPRQGFFLGKIVKKAKRAVKKVVKSPLGKAALLGAAAYGLGGAKFLGGQGIFSGGQGLSRFANLKNLFLPAASNPLGKRGLLAGLAFDDKGQFSLGRAALSGLGATALAAPFLMGGDEEEGEPETPFTQTPDSIASIVNMARNQDPSLRFLPKPKFVDNFYAADGGLASIDTPKRGMVDGPGSYAGRNRTEFLMPENMDRNAPNKFDFLTTTGPLTDKQKEILANMSEEEIKELQEKGTLFDFLENIIKTPFIMRGGDMTYADGGLASIDTPKRGVVDGPGSYAGEKPSFLDNFLSAIGQIKSGQVSANLRGDEEKAKEFIVKSGFGTNFDEDQIAQIIDMKNRGMDLDSIATIMEADPNEINNLFSLLEQKAYGGRIGKAEGGLMDLGGFEKDYREGGFVPLGAEERADDVPARLSKNEFVFTADAVRNAGQGDIDKGAEVMQNMMDNLEAGGTISEESQGMNPAQEMFDQAQMLEGRLA